MRRENHRPVVGNLVQLVDEYGTHLLETLDDKAIVDDLVPYINRRPEPLERQLDDWIADPPLRRSRAGPR